MSDPKPYCEITACGTRVGVEVVIRKRDERPMTMCRRHREISVGASAATPTGQHPKDYS